MCQAHEVVVLGVAAENSKELESFLKAAFYARVAVAHITDASVAAEAGLATPSLTIFAKGAFDVCRLLGPVFCLNCQST